MAQDMSQTKAQRGAVAFARLPARQQLVLWGSLAVICGFLSFAPLIYYIVNLTSLKQQLHIAGDMQLSAQQLGKAAQQASAGDAGAFKLLRQSDNSLGNSIRVLTQGSAEVSAPTGAQLAILSSLNQQWQPLHKNVAQILAMETPLTQLGANAKAINAKEAEMLALAEQVAAHLAQTGASQREVLAAGQLAAYTTQMAQAARHMLARDNPADWHKDLDRSYRTFENALAVLHTSRDGAAREKLDRLAGIYGQMAPDILAMLAGLKPLETAKLAAAPVVAASEQALAGAVSHLAGSYSKETGSGLIEGAITFCLAAFAIAFVVLFARVLINDTRQRTQQSEEKNARNQAAILRLLDEMGGLADGDLTANATVTEDVTGAIADSFNFTIHELRGLVTRINTTTQQVTSAAQRAQNTSATLLQGALKQSQEIKETSASMVEMAESINRVSENAEASAKVAARSLTAAEKGQRAVQDAISGMHEIRQQIQETAKRIKRLGETSQEINEIVDLITDLTEQTNVLALNAAIQAAAAGEAGRGFSVVAEEVQRLAERSAQATKQIGSIVNSIQTDTQNAVAAMEQNTHGVVQGAKLSDATGQALNEIGHVSRDLAELIATISRATREQSVSAEKVVKNMKDILDVTEQTTLGTRQTAESIGQLAGLAAELRGSVANFKV